MFKKIFAVLTILIVVFGVSLVQAKNDKNSDIPEVDGTYDVPGHPELKVRVFVHKANPSPQPIIEERCDLSDPDSGAIVDKEVWRLPPTFTYNLNPANVPALIGSVNWPTIAKNSFNVWESAISNKANVSRGANTSIATKRLDGINIVAWGSASGSALGVTYIWYYPSTGLVVDLDTIMNKKFVWTWSKGEPTCAYTNSYDAQSILTHEIGHWFGLDDEYTSNYVNNTMYGFGFKMDAKGDTLTNGDVTGVRAIYNK